MSRKITFLTLFLWLTAVTFPVIAQQKADTTYTFRFVPREDMFYVPWNGNDTELARLLECIESNKATILDGKLPLYVDGYCNSLGSETENLATAKIRANRVKSELIIRAEIKEENFITRNHATEGDFIIRKTKCFDFWERNVLFPKTKRSFFRTPKHPLPCPFPLNFSLLIITKKFGNLAKNRYICIV